MEVSCAYGEQQAFILLPALEEYDVGKTVMGGCTRVLVLVSYGLSSIQMAVSVSGVLEKRYTSGGRRCSWAGGGQGETA